MDNSKQDVDVFKWAHEHRDEIAWMSQNTNHIAPSNIINDAIEEGIKKKIYQWYPYSKGLFGLNELILDDLHLKEQRSLLTSGGTEALYITIRALLGSGDEVIASDPSYFIIHKFIRLSGAIPVEIPIYKDPWKIPVDEINERITSKTKMILLIDPLNPLGTGYSKEEVKAIAEIARDKKLYVLNDITYRDFSDEHHLAASYYPEGTITIYSVSKNCGLAGMRIGSLVSTPELMNTIAKYNTNDLSVNIIGQIATYKALQTKSQWFPEVKKITRSNQLKIKNMLENFEDIFLPVYPSQANMFIIDVSKTKLDTEAIQGKLLFEHKVFVRAGNYVSAKYGKNFIRVSFSVPEEHAERFINAFPNVINDLKNM